MSFEQHYHPIEPCIKDVVRSHLALLPISYFALEKRITTKSQPNKYIKSRVRKEQTKREREKKRDEKYKRKKFVRRKTIDAKGWF